MNAFEIVASQNGNSSPQAPFSVRTEEVNADQGQYYVMLPDTSGSRLPQIVPGPGARGSSGTMAAVYSNDIVLGGSNRIQNQRLPTVSPIKDIARRQQHNEVERRRRDKINTWINKISRVVPDCSDDHTKQGQSKGGILAKAYEYILDLQQKCGLTEQHYNKEDVEELLNERNQLKNEVDKLRLENAQLRRAIEENGMIIHAEDGKDNSYEGSQSPRQWNDSRNLI